MVRLNVSTTSSNLAILSWNRLTIANFYLLGLPPSKVGNAHVPASANQYGDLGAYNCSLFFCVQGYLANYNLGQSLQTQVAVGDNMQLTWDDDILDFKWSLDNASLQLNILNSSS